MSANHGTDPAGFTPPQRAIFEATTAAYRAVSDWFDFDCEPARDLIGCTPAMVAGVAINAFITRLGLAGEWGIKADDQTYPFSASSWDRAAAVDAAAYNNARWGNKYHPVFRHVTDWQPVDG